MWDGFATLAAIVHRPGLFALGGLIIYAGVSAGRVRLRLGFRRDRPCFVALIFSTKTDSEKKGYRFR